MLKTYLLITILLCSSDFKSDYKLPINSSDRTKTANLKLTEIGKFGIQRKERPGIPSHYHTGIDIKRPSNNYKDEPIYPIFEGIVISIREDGPYAQLIIEHKSNHKFWTVYEHIAGIKVDLFEKVSSNTPIARFMSRSELDKYGWQFDHFHFEILKVQPIKLKPDKSKPERLFASYTLSCRSIKELNTYFYDPMSFFNKQLKKTY